MHAEALAKEFHPQTLSEPGSGSRRGSTPAPPMSPAPWAVPASLGSPGSHVAGRSLCAAHLARSRGPESRLAPVCGPNTRSRAGDGGRAAGPLPAPGTLPAAGPLPAPGPLPAEVPSSSPPASGSASPLGPHLGGGRDHGGPATGAGSEHFRPRCCSPLATRRWSPMPHPRWVAPPWGHWSPPPHPGAPRSHFLGSRHFTRSGLTAFGGCFPGTPLRRRSGEGWEGGPRRVADQLLSEKGRCEAGCGLDTCGCVGALLRPGPPRPQHDRAALGDRRGLLGPLGC